MEPRSLAAVAEAARIPTTGSPCLAPPCLRGLRLVRRRHHQRHVCPGVCVRRLRLFSGYGPHRHTSPRASTRDRCCALAILSMLPLCLRLRIHTNRKRDFCNTRHAFFLTAVRRTS